MEYEPETDVNLRALRRPTVHNPEFRDSLVHKWHRLATTWWKWVFRAIPGKHRED